MKRLNDDLNNIQDIMRKTIDDVLDRGNKLDGKNYVFFFWFFCFLGIFFVFFFGIFTSIYAISLRCLVPIINSLQWE